MEILNSWIIATNHFIWTYVLIALLICVGVYFTFKSKFVQFRNIREMFRLLGNGITSGNHKNSVSSFQAFCIATASRVGTGNLAGVATALALGGPGAIFWMWLIALIGSASAFIESSLAQIYKIKGERSFIGGPAFYMEKGLKKRWLGVLFAIIITITFGLVFNSVQANTVTLAFHEVFGMDKSTAFIILLSDVPLDGTVKGIQLTQLALSHQIGNIGGQFIAICIFLFAFSSIVGNYSYCKTNLFFISKNKTYLQIYRLTVGFMVMFGSIAVLDFVWNMADLFMSIMAITNLISIVLLGKIALKTLQDYNRQRRICKKISYSNHLLFRN